MRRLTQSRAQRALLLALLFIVCLAAPSFADADENPYSEAILLSANLFGPIVGVYTGSVEIPVSPDVSVFIQPEYLNVRWSLLWVILQSLEPDLRDVDFAMTSIGGRVGAHYFLNGVHNGLFVGGAAGYSRVRVAYEGSQAVGNGIYAGARGGYRFIAGPVAVTPFAELGVTFTNVDISGLFGDLGNLGFGEDELDWLVSRQFGFSARLGIALALALY